MSLTDIRLKKQSFKAQAGDVVLCSYDRMVPARPQHIALLINDIEITSPDTPIRVVEHFEIVREAVWDGNNPNYRVDAIGQRVSLDRAHRVQILSTAAQCVEHFTSVIKGDPCHGWGFNKPDWDPNLGPPDMKISCATFIELLYERIGFDLVNDGPKCARLPEWPSELAHWKTTRPDPEVWRARGMEFSHRLFPGYQAYALERNDHTWTPEDFRYAMYPEEVEDFKERWL